MITLANPADTRSPEEDNALADNIAKAKGLLRAAAKLDLDFYLQAYAKTSISPGCSSFVDRREVLRSILNDLAQE